MEMTEQNVPTADELRARVRTAQREEQAAQERCEAFGVLDRTLPPAKAPNKPAQSRSVSLDGGAGAEI